jgi:hypothetical protein
MNYHSSAFAMDVEQQQQELLEAEPLTVGLQLTGGATSAGTFVCLSCRRRTRIAS